ncbi:MAG: tripartite tricarboxylate transporter permease [Fibrobacteria bacterium]|nr:tripartite tricarboxylate transporter permease [Fibrobacteria bacterium]
MGTESILSEVLSSFAPELIGLVLLGTFIGMIVGSLPGLTTTMGLALLAGITYKMDSHYAISMLLGLYVGGVSGGALSAILIGIPGTPASAATALDGLPLSMKGEGGKAITVSQISAVMGTLFGVACMLFLTPVLSNLSLKFTSAEFFLIALFGIMISGSLSGQDLPIKGWMAGALGITVGMVGADELSGHQCLTFGNANLFGGIPFVPVMIGFFGIPQVIEGLSTSNNKIVTEIKKVKTSLKDVFQHWATAIRSGVSGVVIGLIPGVGEDVAAWVSYGIAKRISKNPDKYGKGSYEGLVAAEAGNHACIGSALIPLLSLGIPGSPPAAILLGALLIHGIRPGPMLVIDNPAFLYQAIVYMCVATVGMGVFTLLLAKPLTKILSISACYTMPIITALCVIGAWSLNIQVFDLYLVFIAGVLGILFKVGNIPPAPLILGIILGPMVNSGFRRALQSTHGDLSIFYTRPICIILIISIVLLVLAQLGLFGFIKNMIMPPAKAEEGNQ